MPSSFIKPSDAKSWASCVRRVWFDNQPGAVIEEKDPFEQLIIDMGHAHERVIFERLQRDRHVVRAHSPAQTQELMADAADVIYQGQLLDEQERITGNPDFLIRHSSGDYQAADAKLALNENKKEILAQLGVYRRLLGNNLPGIVFRGDGSQAEIGDESNKVTDAFIEEMRAILTRTSEPDVRYSHSKCRACPYYAHCRPAFERKEELSLLYGVEGRAAEALEREGIRDISALAAREPDQVPDVSYLKGSANKTKAVLQARAYLTGEVFKLHDLALPEGHWVHFDIEDNPLTLSGEKHVYLWGFLEPDYRDADYRAIWTDSQEADRDGWLGFLDFVASLRKWFPDLILAHYTDHEVTTIKKYAERYDMQHDETVSYLLGDQSPLFDLYKPVKDNLVLPIDGYGLKAICKHKDLVSFQWQDQESSGQWSMVQFVKYLEETDSERKSLLKEKIVGYNRDDVMATRALEIWLRENF